MESGLFGLKLYDKGFGANRRTQGITILLEHQTPV